MTDLQSIRIALMEQLGNIKDGKSDNQVIGNLIGLSTSVVKTYNVELRVNELGLKYGDKDFEAKETDVFKDMQEMPDTKETK
tara:strand:- start:371 stop:616 length:246 start_codon:yes stop_codon:yes gene_type:complete